MGGAIAGLIARRDGAYQGSLAAVVTILAIALLPVPSPTETVEILLFDALLLGIGAAAGWLGARARGASPS